MAEGQSYSMSDISEELLEGAPLRELSTEEALQLTLQMK